MGVVGAGMFLYYVYYACADTKELPKAKELSAFSSFEKQLLKCRACTVFIDQMVFSIPGENRNHLYSTESSFIRNMFWHATEVAD